MKDAQVGFNTNVRYQGRTLHIQTEDSGRGRPHVITHLYIEGTIVATKRTSYEDCSGADDVVERVRALMKGQHKAMILELRDGRHDEAVRRLVEGCEAVQAGDAAAALLVEAEAAAGEAAVPVPDGAVDEIRARPSYRPPAPGEGGPDVVVFPAEDEPTQPVEVVRARGGRRPGALRPVAYREREGFAKDLISDRSLDEVVLSYLAEELTKDDEDR